MLRCRHRKRFALNTGRWKKLNCAVNRRRKSSAAKSSSLLEAEAELVGKPRYKLGGRAPMAWLRIAISRPRTALQAKPRHLAARNPYWHWRSIFATANPFAADCIW